MSQFYSDPKRARDPNTLPDMETFRVYRDDKIEDEDGGYLRCGWYYWACFPGCLPDGPAIGPYRSERAAIRAARDNCLD